MPSLSQAAAILRFIGSFFPEFVATGCSKYEESLVVVLFQSISLLSRFFHKSSYQHRPSCWTLSAPLLAAQLSIIFPIFLPRLFSIFFASSTNDAFFYRPPRLGKKSSPSLVLQRHSMAAGVVYTIALIIHHSDKLFLVTKKVSFRTSTGSVLETLEPRFSTAFQPSAGIFPRLSWSRAYFCIMVVFPGRDDSEVW